MQREHACFIKCQVNKTSIRTVIIVEGDVLRKLLRMLFIKDSLSKGKKLCLIVFLMCRHLIFGIEIVLI